MSWSVKTPYAMFSTLCGRRYMHAYHDSVLDKEEMKRLWEAGTPTVKSGIECECFDVRHLELSFFECRYAGSYEFFLFENSDGTLYPMFARDAAALLEKDVLRHDISGDFKMVRHGSHFGVAMV